MVAVGGRGGGDASAIFFNELVQSHQLQSFGSVFFSISYSFAIGSSTLKAFGCPFANQYGVDWEGRRSLRRVENREPEESS
jgi:hypothetical protein